ncbi:MAG: ABC transporter permease, partial [Anaerolineales bacterium]|nr:ABC transporter permease [Anaerolineales bacterium]
MSRSPLRLRSLPALAWRNLAQHRARTALSVLAVAAGVASVVGTNVLNRAILAAIGSSPDTQAITSGLMTQLETSLLGAGVAIALAAGFLILNAFLMSVTQRRQQLGVLRALGMPRRMLLQLILMEALIVAGLGSALGFGAGPLLARLIGQLLRETTVNAFAPQAPSLAVLAA